jgi:hypothetical protein
MNGQEELMALMKEQNDLLKEILKWMRFSGSNQVREILRSVLDNEKKKLAYFLSDGKNTTRVIAQIIGINQKQISEYWREWLIMGLGEALPTSGGNRFQHSFDLKMFGMTVPELKQSNQQKEGSIEPSKQSGDEKR